MGFSIGQKKTWTMSSLSSSGKQPSIVSSKEMSWYQRSQGSLLDPNADDDDIDWKADPFEMRPDSANPEMPDEIIALIKFSGSPWLQEQLRSLCREYIDPVPAHTSQTIGHRNRNRFPPRHHSAEKTSSHPLADKQTARARRHRGITGQWMEASSPST